MIGPALVRWRRLLSLLSVAALAVFPTYSAVARAAGLDVLATDQTPYFVARHAGLLYLVVPIAVVAASVLFLTPGLLLAVVIGAGETVASWIATGFLLSVVVVSVAGAVATALAGAPVMGGSFALVVLAVAGGCALWADALVRTGRRQPPDITRDDLVSVAMMVGIVLVTWWLMSPKFLWENFNGDGAHAYESSRLLVRHAAPFWPNAAGPVAGFPGMTSLLFTYPNGWFLRLFGEYDVSVRVPFLLYLAVLFATLVAVAESATRRIGVMARLAMAIGLVAYAYAMAYSATYNPYSADIALPATQDTLLMICFVAAARAYWRLEWGWFAFTAALTYLSLPNGLILLGFLMLADLLVTRPRPWRDAGRVAVTLIGCVVGSALLARGLVSLGAPPPGGEYGLIGVLKYFAFLQFTDWTRTALVLVPAGIVPVLILFRWSALDGPARALACVTAAYFLFFFVQAHVSLHHFVPAMILPVAAALRATARPVPAARRWTATWLGAALVAVAFSLPRTFVVQNAGREIGQSLVIDVGDYRRSDPSVFRHSTLLERLFPFDWDPGVPFGSYGGSPLVWNRYAQHGATARLADANYALLLADAPAPEGMHRVAADSGAVLYVRDDARWAADKARRPPTPAGSDTYYLPRSILFRGVPNTDGPPIIDVVATMERMGVDMTPVLARLGVRR